MGNLLCDQIIIYQKNFFENKNHNVNENFGNNQVWCLFFTYVDSLKKKKNCKHKEGRKKTFKINIMT